MQPSETSVRSGTGGLIGRAGGSPPVLCCEALLPHAKNSFDLTTRIMFELLTSETIFTLSGEAPR